MSFIDLLNEERKIELIVIDEAHCISEWGSDFRPDYSRLGEIKSLFPGTRLLGMSATIPPEALKDLIAKLKITGCYYFQSSSNRPNLIYEVMNTEKSKVAGSIIDYVKQKQLKKECGIVYCQTIKNAEEIFKEL
jgi:superfamily II DNA helicase RecQ